MKLLIPIFLALALGGCSTMIMEDGKPVFRTYADIDGLDFHTAKSYLKAKKINHSIPTRAGGSVVGTASTGLAGIIAAWFTKGVVR